MKEEINTHNIDRLTGILMIIIIWIPPPPPALICPRRSPICSRPQWFYLVEPGGLFVLFPPASSAHRTRSPQTTLAECRPGVGDAGPAFRQRRLTACHVNIRSAWIINALFSGLIRHRIDHRIENITMLSAGLQATSFIHLSHNGLVGASLFGFACFTTALAFCGGN